MSRLTNRKALKAINDAMQARVYLRRAMDSLESAQSMVQTFKYANDISHIRQAMDSVEAYLSSLPNLPTKEPEVVNSTSGSTFIKK